MRILVVGAGATGGYFGGRLAQAGCDVTFLVRPARAARLAATGLVIASPRGDFVLPAPATVRAGAVAAPFDLVMLSCKAYDLEDAIDAFAPAVGPHSAILPLLNGMRHLDALDARFGSERVLGGQCVIAATLDERGAIVHLNETHGLTFGERTGGLSARVRSIAGEFAAAAFDARASEDIAQDMWEKWIVLATLAASTCLMRASVGEIVAAPSGRACIEGLFAECAAIGAAHGRAPRAAFADKALALLTQAGSALTASMLRDLEAGARIEADHIVGDLIARRPAGAATPAPALLDIAFAHLKAYENRCSRTTAA